jgi:hypothetical protein
MVTVLEVFPDEDPTPSMAWTTSRPSLTCPKTTCLPSNQEVLTVQMKNWEPLLQDSSVKVRAQSAQMYVRSGTSVGHGEDTGASVPQVEVLILELLAVDGLATSAL